MRRLLLSLTEMQSGLAKNSQNEEPLLRMTEMRFGFAEKCANGEPIAEFD